MCVLDLFKQICFKGRWLKKFHSNPSLRATPVKIFYYVLSNLLGKIVPHMEYNLSRNVSIRHFSRLRLRFNIKNYKEKNVVRIIGTIPTIEEALFNEFSARLSQKPLP